MSHFIRFYSGEGKPTIFARSLKKDAAADEEGAVNSQGEVVSLVLEGFEDISFSGSVACIGYRSPKGYRPCPNHAINVRQCPTCAGLDISRAYTVGDFSGQSELYAKAQEEEYALYLAGFGEDILKCGVTRKERFESRMREQGADFGCIISVFKGPDRIYMAEHEVQARFNFSNSVRLAQKMRRLQFDYKAARDNFSSAVRMVSASGIVPDSEKSTMEFSQFYPRVENVHEEGAVMGKILGAKGEILLYSSDGNDYAVNMRKKVGTFFERKEKP
jgi:hypothetical protein